MNKELWIFAEQNDGIIASSFYEMLTKAKAVYAGAGEMPCFTAVCFGKDTAATDELKKSGADKVICAAHEKLEAYNPMIYTAAMAELAAELKPETILIAASAIGSEFAPGVSARLKTGLAAHCTELTLGAEDELHMIAPAFGGNLMGEYIIPQTRPVMASIKPGVFDREALTATDAEVVTVIPKCLETLSTGVEFVDRTVNETVELPIEKAEVVICAGLGSGVSDSLGKLQELAKLLNASVCYTRPMVDLGYFQNESAMVGSSGKTIKPKLYIGFGVSGAGQHVCGMKDSGLIINVNNDDTALSFEISNYKVVGDCGAILDELISQLK